MAENLNRRDFLGKSVTAVGAAGLIVATDRRLSGATPAGKEEGKENPQETGAATQGDMPCGMIGKVKISRVILGSNLMGGYSHSRDLSYVGPLMRAYNTEEKILETLALAESVGINTISQGDWTLVNKYNNEHGGHMQQLGPLNIKIDDDDQKVRDSVRQLVDQGPAAIYIFGHDSDLLVRDGRVDMIGKAIQWIQDEGVAGWCGRTLAARGDGV